MSFLPKISVIVPVYNTEQYLRRCVDSILAQTFTDFELILVDDGSTDKSGIICEEYAQLDSRVIVFHQENRGQAAARNFALDWMFANSNSEYVSFVDSDDFVHPQYLELLLFPYDCNCICACNMRQFKNDNEIIDCIYSAEYQLVNPEFIYTHGEKKVFAYACGFLYKRNLWKEIRFPIGKRWEDLAIIHKVLFSVREIAWIKYELYYYFQNPDGTTFSEWGPWKDDFIHVLNSLQNDPVIRKNPKVFEAVKHTLVSSLIRRISFLEKKIKEPGQKYKESLNFHRRILRKSLVLYHRDFCFSQNKYLYSLAYPRLMKAYWVCVGIIGRIKRMVK